MQFTNPDANYDMVAIMHKKGPGELQLRDYMHDAVKVQKLEGKGRGMITTQDILPGELIIAAKSIAIVFRENVADTGSNLRTELEMMGTLRQKVAQSLRDHPDLIPKVYNLWAGPHLGYLENAHPQDGVDTDRIERICAMNGFKGDRTAGSFGLWYLPSFLNHNCHESNAHWRIFQNMIFVRAAKRILSGEEILISYVDPNRPYSDRRKLFVKHDFFCHCTLCELENKEGKEIRNKRDNLLSDFYSQNENSVADCFRLINDLKAIRPEHRDLNVFLISPLLELGICCYENAEYENAAMAFTNCFNLCQISSAQFSLVQVSCALTIATCYLRQTSCCSASVVQKWIDISKSCVRIQYGGFNKCTSLIQDIRPTFVEVMKSAGFNLD